MTITRREALLTGLGLTSVAGASQPHPLYFEPNRGQFGPGPVFCVNQKRWRASFETKRIHIRMSRLVGDGVVSRRTPVRDLELSLVQAAGPAPVGEDQRLGRSDYYFHGDPKTFIRDVPHYYRLRYRNAWPGVDLLVRGWEGALELSVSLAAGAIPQEVRMHWTQGDPQQQRDGTVVVNAPWGVVKQVRPRALSWRIESDGLLRLA